MLDISQHDFLYILSEDDGKGGGEKRGKMSKAPSVMKAKIKGKGAKGDDSGKTSKTKTGAEKKKGGKSKK